jgi:hypothetical protein
LQEEDGNPLSFGNVGTIDLILSANVLEQLGQAFVVCTNPSSHDGTAGVVACERTPKSPRPES